MQLKTFVLPIKNLAAAETEMNAFLRSHRVLAVKKEFGSDAQNSFRTFCVQPNEGRCQLSAKSAALRGAPTFLSA